MMSTQRYHTAGWQNDDGSAVAVLLDVFDSPGDWPTAVAASHREAVEQLKKFLQWRAKRDEYLAESDIEGLETITIRVDVRQAFELDDRTISFPDTVAIPVACVDSKRDEDARTCYIPAFQLTFDYTRDDDFKQLVKQYVQQHVKGMNSRELARLLKPESLVLDSFLVRVDEPKSLRERAVKLPSLSAAAEAVLGRSGGQYSAWARENEIATLVNALEKERASVLVVGAPGIGKTTVINAAAAAVRRSRKLEGDRQGGLQRYWRTAAGRLIAGMKYLGQWEQRCEAMVDELSAIDGVLAIDNLLELVRVGGAPTESVAAFFTPYIEHGDIRIVTEATEEELDACRRLLPSLVNQLQIVRLEPWPRSIAMDVLARQAKQLEERFSTPFEPTVPELVYHLYQRFLPHHVFPGRAFLLLQDVFTFARTLEQAADNDIVLDRFAEATGLPEIMLRDDMPLDRQTVFQFLSDRVIGQSEPCGLLSDFVLTFKSTMNDTGRPIGVMLLCGPTGVGKTESAKALADFLFPHLPEKNRLIRLDMSEFAGPGAVERLLAQPSGEPSDFVRQVRRQPFSVLLLDEIEKASPDVFDLLLGVLDEGRLVDTYGRVTDFRCCFILMTSNIAGDMSGPFGFSRQASVDPESEVLGAFRPEFFNRLDAVVRYQPLDVKTMHDVAKLHLSLLVQRQGFRSRNVSLAFSNELIQYLADRGCDERYGARPLQRLIEEFVVTPLAERFVAEPDLRGVEIKLDLVDNALMISVP